jgi:hypothetical protein
MMKVTVYTSEISVSIPEDINLHNHRRKNLKCRHQPFSISEHGKNPGALHSSEGTETSRVDEMS